MQNYLKGNSTLVAIMLIFSFSVMLYRVKEEMFYHFSLEQNTYAQFLSRRLLLQEQLSEPPSHYCNQPQNVNGYNTFCEEINLFKNYKYLPKKKYIPFNMIEDVLNIQAFENEIYSVETLEDLPNSSKYDPKIVWIAGPINERLTQNFYGIIITEDSFKITGKKIYGLFISPNEEDSNTDSRNISYNKDVIKNLSLNYHKQKYISHSRNLLNNVE